MKTVNSLSFDMYSSYHRKLLDEKNISYTYDISPITGIGPVEVLHLTTSNKCQGNDCTGNRCFWRPRIGCTKGSMPSMKHMLIGTHFLY